MAGHQTGGKGVENLGPQGIENTRELPNVGFNLDANLATAGNSKLISDMSNTPGATATLAAKIGTPEISDGDQTVVSGAAPTDATHTVSQARRVASVVGNDTLASASVTSQDAGTAYMQANQQLDQQV